MCIIALILVRPVTATELKKKHQRNTNTTRFINNHKYPYFICDYEIVLRSPWGRLAKTAT